MYATHKWQWYVIRQMATFPLTAMLKGIYYIKVFLCSLKVMLLFTFLPFVWR